MAPSQALACLEIARDSRVPPLEKFIALRRLQRDDPRAFYAILIERTEELLPYVYTPTVGEVCQNYHRLPIEPVGLYLTPEDIPDGGVLKKLVRYLGRRQSGGKGGGGGGDGAGENDDAASCPSSSSSSSSSSSPVPPVDVVVVTDSARILGLGDCGAGGMGISEGKILLYTAVGGVAPAGCVPVCLDVGTDRRELLADPLYKGVRAPRASGEVLDSLVGELVGALKELLRREKEANGGPSKQATRTTLLQFEDFASSSAFRLLDKFAPCGLPCFNDDVQGTASVGLAALLAALRLGDSSSSAKAAKGAGGEDDDGAASSSSSPHPPPRPLSSSLSDHLVLFYGAGEAGVGIGELVAAAIQKRSSSSSGGAEMMTREQARRRCVFIDSRGLVTAERAAAGELAHHKLPFAHAGLPQLEESKNKSKGEKEKDQLLFSAVRALRPTALVGVSTSPGAFSPRVLKEMAAVNRRPIVMPLSNPTSLAECTFEEAVAATEGRCVFASGSPFDAIAVSSSSSSSSSSPSATTATTATATERTSLSSSSSSSSSPLSFRRCSQANNAYIFPAVGAAALLTGATALGEGAFLAAAEALAAQATSADARAGLLFPPFSRAADVSAAVAAAVAEELVRSGDGTVPASLEYFARGAAREPGLGGWEAALRSRMVNLGSTTASRL